MRADFTNASIVLLGSFDPDAFLPDALANAKVISKNEAKNAKFRLLGPGALVQFDLSWGQLLVARDRFQVGTNEAPYVRICDFAMKALHDLPSKSSVSAFGINLESHFNLGSVDARDVLGRRIAPPEAWGKWGQELLKSMKGNTLLHGGVMSLQMRKPFFEEKVSGWLDITAGPSSRVSNNAGVVFRTNHHHQLPKKVLDDDEIDQPVKASPDGLALLEFLAERFDGSIQSANSIFSGVLKT